MGQKVGKAKYIEDVEPFLSSTLVMQNSGMHESRDPDTRFVHDGWCVCVCTPVPKDAVDDLWEAFNDVAEGFGVDVDELKEIFVILQEPLDLAKKPLATLTEALFKDFDTDEVSAMVGRHRFLFRLLSDSH